MPKSRLGTDPFAPSGGVHALIQDTRESTPEISSLSSIQSNSSKHSSRIGLKPGWTRATFIVRDDILEKLKDLAWWDRKDIKEVLEEALTSHLANKTFESRKTQQALKHV
jgi:hypothetical protein